MTNVLLFLLYLILLPIGVARRLLGRDTLQLRPPRHTASYWLARGSAPPASSYFSEASAVEGISAKNTDGQLKIPSGACRLLTPFFLAVARLYAPPRTPEARSYSAAAERERGIPDEVYTLW